MYIVYLSCQANLLRRQTAHMVTSGWWVEEDQLWAELKSVFIMYGAQYVMMDGAEMMPMLHVDN